jgi:Flp pilus assembly protein TadG
MKTSIIRRRAGRVQDLRHKRRGAAVVEMAVVTPLLLLILFGIMEFGWVFMMEQTITNATREAARVGILQGATHTDIQNRFTQAMAPTGIAVTGDMLTIVDPTTADPTLTVRVSMPYSKVSILGNFLGLNQSRMIGSSCSMRAEG